MSRSVHPQLWITSLACLWTGALALSGWAPHDRLTWLLEVAPALIALPLLLATRRSFPLTPLLCCLIALHGLVLMAGGAYTYARVPLGFWLQDCLALDRNPYDKIGHFFQGLVPALLAREILLRKRHINPTALAPVLCISVAMAVSALYELLEWASALALGQNADDFLGTQGDPWDTQSDMFMALLGSFTAMLTLTRLQDRQILNLPPQPHIHPPASPSATTAPTTPAALP